MRILLKSVEIIDTRSPFNGQKKNIFIENGKIRTINNENPEADKIIEGEKLKCSIGWFDMWATFSDPGNEHKEDLFTGCQAAAAGGFTDVALLPNTKPVIQSKNEVLYLQSKNAHQLTQIHPIAAVTIENKGTELTDMIDLYEAGAVAFSDGEEPVWHSDILMKTLLYLQKFNGLLINKAENKQLTAYGSMNEGINSTMLGLKGIPKLAEELMVARDIRLLEYAGGKIHFTNVSSAQSVDLIRKAKMAGLNVTCDTAAYQLYFDDSVLKTFDTNFKVNPPFREQHDIDALIEGLKDGTIDAIVSSHTPQDEENKNLEFDLAAFGIIGLQTMLPILTSLRSKVDLNLLINKISIMPRKLLGLEIPEIKENSSACLTVFDEELEWNYNDRTNLSKSKNSPFFGQKLKGKTVAVLNKNKVFIND